MTEPRKCLVEGCKNILRRTGSARGLCTTCYGHALKLVKSGKTTWEALDRQCKVRIGDHRGGGPGYRVEKFRTDWFDLERSAK